MFNKVAAFKMLQSGRPARNVMAPANDNRRDARPCILQRNRTPRLICRWSLSPDTGRPVSRWELDRSDEPSPRLRAAPSPAAPSWLNGTEQSGMADRARSELCAQRPFERAKVAHDGRAYLISAGPRQAWV